MASTSAWSVGPRNGCRRILNEGGSKSAITCDLQCPMPRDEELEALEAQYAELRRMLFGQRSERMPSMAFEVGRAMDADALVGPSPIEDPEEATVNSVVPVPETEETKRRKRSEKERQAARAERNHKLPVTTERVVVTPD
jgi:hypothetical protein